MQEILSFGKKTIASHKYTAGVAMIAEMTDTMYAVMAFDKNGWVITSRNFAFTENCKKDVMKECRSFYNFIKDCLSKKELSSIEDWDD